MSLAHTRQSAGAPTWDGAHDGNGLVELFVHCGARGAGCLHNRGASECNLSAFLLAVDWLSCGLARQRTIAVEPVRASLSASAPQWLTNATLAWLGRRAGLWMERTGNLERSTVGRLHKHVPREGQGERQWKAVHGEGGSWRKR